MPRARANESCDIDASVTRARSRRASRFARRDVTTNASAQPPRRDWAKTSSLLIETARVYFYFKPRDPLSISIASRSR